MLDDAGTWTGVKFKARLNVRGDQQRDDQINPDHRSSPTADIDSIRLFIATLAGDPNNELLKFDVVGAFLQAKLDPRQPPIFMHAPQGMHLAPGQMLKLNTNIYGLVEAAYLWFMEFSAKAKQLGWIQGSFDPFIFTMPGPDGSSGMIIHG